MNDDLGGLRELLQSDDLGWRSALLSSTADLIADHPDPVTFVSTALLDTLRAEHTVHGNGRFCSAVWLFFKTLDGGDEGDSHTEADDGSEPQSLRDKKIDQRLEDAETRLDLHSRKLNDLAQRSGGAA